MESIKTLSKACNELVFEGKKDSTIFMSDLRESAIKDIRALRRTALQRNLRYYDRVIEYIMFKFNIKEKDLK